MPLIHEKLDDAFLFILTLATLAFTIVQTSRNDLDSLIVALPVLLAGVALPFYVGYVRGAVIRNSPLDKVRGWIILVVGNFTMFGLLIVQYTNQAFPEYPVSIVGLMTAWYIAAKLVRAYPLDMNRNTMRILVGSGIFPLLFSVIVTVASLLLQAWLVAHTFPLIISYLAFVWPLLALSLVIIGAERTCEVLQTPMLVNERGDKAQNALDYAFERSWKYVLPSLLDFGLAGLDFVPRHKRVLVMFLTSFGLFCTLGWFFPNSASVGWSNILLIVVAADGIMTVTIADYLRISDSGLLGKAQNLSRPEEKGMEDLSQRREAARKWLEKYVEQFMFNDIKACIEGKANFAAALALSVYSEILGGLLNGAFEDKGDGKFNNHKTFLEHMGYKDAGRIYGLVRGGLTHQYFIKQESTVFLWGTTEKHKGIVIAGDNIEFHVVDYFQEFQSAYARMKREILEGDPKALTNFEKAVGAKTIPSEAQVGGIKVSLNNSKVSSP